MDKVKDIPWDYDGVMGVPITIFEYDLDNVEIVGILGPVVDGKKKYKRILISRK